MAGIARRDAVVHLVEADGQVEVLGPEHGLGIGGEPAQAAVAPREPAGQQRRGGRVDRERFVDAVRGVVGVEALGHAGVHADARCDLGDRAAERDPRLLGHQLAVLHPQRALDLPEPARQHPQPDGPVRAVLRPGQQHLGHGVQRPPGGDHDLLVHLDLLCVLPSLAHAGARAAGPAGPCTPACRRAQGRTCARWPPGVHRRRGAARRSRPCRTWPTPSGRRA